MFLTISIRFSRFPLKETCALKERCAVASGSSSHGQRNAIKVHRNQGEGDGDYRGGDAGVFEGAWGYICQLPAPDVKPDIWNG